MGPSNSFLPFELVLCIFLFSSGGCGTLISRYLQDPWEEPRTPCLYGGTLFNLSVIPKAGGGIFLLDIPFSLVADTLFLPITIYEQFFGCSSRLHVAVFDGELERARALLNKGTGIDARDRQGNTPLILAAKLGRKEIVRLLLDHGADTRAVDRRGNTALDIARERGGPEIIEWLSRADSHP